jgi:hypothetical protein
MKRAKYTQQWTRDGVPIPGATGDTYTLTAEDDERVIGFVWVPNKAMRKLLKKQRKKWRKSL